MSAKAIRVWVFVVTAIQGAVVAWAVLTQNFLAAIIAIVLACGIIYNIQMRSKEVACDERTNLLSDKAAAATFRWCVPVAGVGATVILTLKDHLPGDMVSVAYGLAYGACVLLGVNGAFYLYYSRKH